MEWFKDLPVILQAIFQIAGIIVTLLIALGVLDRKNKVVKIWDKIGDIQKAFSKKKPE